MMTHVCKLAMAALFGLILGCGSSKQKQQDAAIKKAAGPLILSASEIKEHFPEFTGTEVDKNISWESFLGMDSIHYDYVRKDLGVYVLSTVTWDVDEADAENSAALMDKAIASDASNLLGTKVTRKSVPTTVRWGDHTEAVTLWVDQKEIGMAFVGLKDNLVYHWMICGVPVDPAKLQTLLKPKLEAFAAAKNPIAAAIK